MTFLRRNFDWPRADPPTRFAHTVETASSAGCRVALLGLPDDTGVRMNGGRPGAAEGPLAFREALSRYGVALPMARDGAPSPWPGVFDAGDVVPGATLEDTHSRVTEAAASLLDEGLLPVAVGGGHDLTFPFVRALAEQTPAPLQGIYLDAHLDVRDAPGSGMPFRALVEACGVEALHLRGMDPFSNSAEHLEWFTTHGGSTEGFGPGDSWPRVPLFMSVDLDVLDQTHAPGVSASNPSGWSPGQVEAWVRAAGENPQVGCFDLMELSPPWDEGGRTARLAARLFLAFLSGVEARR